MQAGGLEWRIPTFKSAPSSERVGGGVQADCGESAESDNGTPVRHHLSRSHDHAVQQRSPCHMSKRGCLRDERGDGDIRIDEARWSADVSLTTSPTKIDPVQRTDFESRD